MSKIAVVYWSGTGNTEAMANAVLEGAKNAGADAVLYTASGFSPEDFILCRCRCFRMSFYGR